MLIILNDFYIYLWSQETELKKSYIIIGIILIVLILDQWLKFYIKTNFQYGQGYDILGLTWAKIHFVENEGMAFGITLGGKAGKLILSLFRIIMVGVLGYIIKKLIDGGESLGLLISFALIIAGALGNIIDSAFYGVFFTESTYHGSPSEFLPSGGGYAPFLFGHVVDMFYFPLIDTVLPDWVPFWGGESFRFFKPVFNIADAAISVGVVSILLFHRNFFKEEEKEEKPAENISFTEGTVATDVISSQEGE